MKNFKRTASNSWSTYPKKLVTLQKERLRLHVAIWAYSNSIEHNENKTFSILTIQLLVVCLTLVWWPTTVTAKAVTSRQKEKPYGSKNNLTVRQNEKDSRQKEKPHGKKKKTQSKKKTSRQKEKDSRQNFFDTERTF